MLTGKSFLKNIKIINNKLQTVQSQAMFHCECSYVTAISSHFDVTQIQHLNSKSKNVGQDTTNTLQNISIKAQNLNIEKSRAESVLIRCEPSSAAAAWLVDCHGILCFKC